MIRPLLVGLGLVGLGSAASCLHQTTRTPVGPVLVYQNGKLGVLNQDYTAGNPPGSSMPVISPFKFAVGDRFAVVFDRAVPNPFPGITWAYQLWREEWTCTEGNFVPSLIWGTCEDGLWSGNSAMLPGTFSRLACENLSGGDLRITRVTCRSDVTGQRLDVQTFDGAGVPHSIMAAPIDCTPGRAEGVPIAGSSYPSGGVLQFVYAVPGSNVHQMVGTVTLERPPGIPLALLPMPRALANALLFTPSPAVLTLDSAAVGPLDPATLALSLAAPTSPAAIEWTLTFPPDLALSISPGPALAQKTLNCANTPGSVKCVASGLNALPIPDGVVALVNVRGPVAVAALGASPDALPIPIIGQAGGVVINPLGMVRWRLDSTF